MKLMALSRFKPARIKTTTHLAVLIGEQGFATMGCWLPFHHLSAQPFSPFDDLFHNLRILRMITWPQAGTAGKPAADTKDSYQALAPCFVEMQKDADAYPWYRNVNSKNFTYINFSQYIYIYLYLYLYKTIYIISIYTLYTVCICISDIQSVDAPLKRVTPTLS